MTVCSYYLRGACKYGDRCRYEHPGAPGNFGNQTWVSSNNRIAVSYTVETLAADVTPLKDKPLWPLSSYGPSKYEPVVISGLDESPEELRLKAVIALKTGASNEYTKYEAEKTAAAERVYANARNNVRKLYEQTLKVSTQSQVPTPTTTTSPSSASGTSAMASAFGDTTTSAFGKSAFGQPAFGQIGFGGSGSAFGQGAQGTSAFGAPAQPVSAFGQPSQTASAFGQATQNASAFSQQTQQSSAFGQPPTFGVTTQPTSAFGQPLTQPTSAFGKPSQPSSVFGQPSQPTSAFGQPSQPASAFAQPAQPMSVFSQPPQSAPSFGQVSQPAFGQSSIIKPASGAFGAGGGGGFSAFASQPSSFTSPAAPSGPVAGMTPSQSAFGPAPAVQSAFGTAPPAPKSAFESTQLSPFGASSFSNAFSVPAGPSPSSAISGSSPFASSPMPVTPSNDKSASSTPDFATAKLTAKMRPGADRYLGLFPRDYGEMIPVDIKAAFASAKFEWGKVPDWIPPGEVR